MGNQVSKTTEGDKNGQTRTRGAVGDTRTNKSKSSANRNYKIDETINETLICNSDIAKTESVIAKETNIYDCDIEYPEYGEPKVEFESMGTLMARRRGSSYSDFFHNISAETSSLYSYYFKKESAEEKQKEQLEKTITNFGFEVKTSLERVVNMKKMEMSVENSGKQSSKDMRMYKRIAKECEALEKKFDRLLEFYKVMDKPREMYEKLQLINQNLEDIKRLKFPFSTLGNKEKVTKKGGLKARRVSVHCTTEAVCERRYERRYTNIPAVFACDGADDGSGSSSSGSCDNGGATIYQGKQRLMTSKSVLYPSKTLGKFEDSLESIVSYDRVAGIGLDDNGLHSEDNKQTFYEKNVTVGFDNLAHQTGTKLNSSKSYSFTLEAQDSLFVPKDVPKHGPFSHKRSHLSSLHNTRSIINHSSFPHQRSVSTAEEQFHLNTSQKLEYPSVSREFTLSARTLSSSTPQKIDSMLVESLDTLKALELEVESNFSTLNNRADTAISAFRRNSLCKIDESNRVMFLNPKSPKLGPQLSYLPLDAELSMGSRFRDQRLVSNRGLNNKQSSKNCHSNDTPRVSPRVKQRPSSVFFSSTIGEPEYTFSIDNNLLST